MDTQYYVRRLKRGLLYSCAFLISWYCRDVQSLESNIICTLLVVASCLLFPYATRFFEQFAHATFTYGLWHKLFGVETPRNNTFIMFYHLFCLAAALPVGGLFFIVTGLRKG